MHRTVSNLAAAAVAITLVAGACSATGAAPATSASPQGGATPGGSPSPAPVSSELILRVAYEGGFVAPSGRLAQPPIVAVYADGRIITPGAITMEYPGRLVAPLQVRDVGADGARAILAAATAAGLTGADAAYPAVGIADAPDTVFVIVKDGTRITTRFGALAEGMGVPGGQGPSEPARKAAADFLARLSDPADAFGGTATAQTLYVPAAYEVWVSPGAPDGSDPALTQEPVEWPLASPLATFGKIATPDVGIEGMRVGVVAGADATTLQPILARANTLTPFTSGGASYTLLVRPLLPGEVPSP